MKRKHKIRKQKRSPFDVFERMVNKFLILDEENERSERDSEREHAETMFFLCCEKVCTSKFQSIFRSCGKS